ncbi:MAG: hypothetical protein HY553_01740 [Elusimicrobia bacterium]|nr:hypothetical protein [Elusimicrobiota bacterium]
MRHCAELLIGIAVLLPAGVFARAEGGDDLSLEESYAAMSGRLRGAIAPIETRKDVPAKAGPGGPALNGVDVGDVLGTYRASRPQFGCPMTVYARFQAGMLQVWTAREDAAKPSGGRKNRPRFTFLDTEGRYVWYEDRRTINSTRSLSTVVERGADSLSVSQRTVATAKMKGIFAPKPVEYGDASIRLSLENGRTLTLGKGEGIPGAVPRTCRFEKVSTASESLPPRRLRVGLRAPIRYGGWRAFGSYIDGTRGELRASFELEEFAEFHQDTRALNFSWEIILADGRRFAAERPLPAGNWRSASSGWLSPGTAPLRLNVGGGVMGAVNGALTRDLRGAFILELESSGTTGIEGRDHILRLFAACDPDLTRCGLIRSVVDSDPPGFYRVPFDEAAHVNIRSDGDAVMTLEGVARR